MSPSILWIAFLFTAGLSLCPRAAWSQGIVCSLGPQTSPYDPRLDGLPSPYADQEARRIYQLLCPKGCGGVAYLQNQTVPNAMTMTISGGASKIVYSPDFMGRVFNRFGAAASFGVIAHEFGHHVDLNSNPASWFDHSWGRELRADAWAGCALARAGLPSQQLATALLAIAAFPSPSHPAWNLRLPALQAGFKSCGGDRELLDQALRSSNGSDSGPRQPDAKAGCSSDSDCKGDRVCDEGRCKPPSKRKCRKDSDCPGDLVCDADSGQCTQP